MFLDWYSNVKNNFLKNKKNIILIYFQVKNTLKNNHYHTKKYYFNHVQSYVKNAHRKASC
jgi:hypothetical protein